MNTNTNHELDTNAPKSSVPETNDPKTNLPEANVPETNALETPETDDAIPRNAFLLIEGVRVLPLKEPVINIGRRLENHVVIDDPRISRQHAQLRAIRGNYVLFDLDSTGGTFVNGQRTTQTVIYPEDVISLSGVILVFGQDSQATDLGETSLLGKPESGTRSASTAERRTVDIEAVSSEPQTHGDADPEAGTLP